MQKLAAGMQDIAQWDVLLEQVFDAGQIARVKSDKRRAEGGSLVERLARLRDAGAEAE